MNAKLEILIPYYSHIIRQLMLKTSTYPLSCRLCIDMAFT